MVHTGWVLAGGFIGFVTGWGLCPAIDGVTIAAATHVAGLFKNLLSLVSLPLIFLSIVASLSGMGDRGNAARIGGRVLRYTLLTTIIAAAVGVLLFFLLQPIAAIDAVSASTSLAGESGLYWEFLRGMVPSNLVMAFSGQGSVMALVFLGVLFGFAILSLEGQERTTLTHAFSSLFSLMIAITRMILNGMPVAVWAFTALFVHGMRGGQGDMAALIIYFITVVLANVIQGTVVLPLFVWFKNVNPWRLVKAFQPALTLAFLSKSSNMTLPVTLSCAQERAGIKPRVAQFSLPLCATINMNGCAAFIIITIFFVARMYGMVFDWFDVASWVFIATLAAVGNAGVPMGCFFLTSAFLVHLKLPVEIMGVILPLYTMLDMVETALNVWSDACVTAVVDREVVEE